MKRLKHILFLFMLAHLIACSSKSEQVVEVAQEGETISNHGHSHSHEPSHRTTSEWQTASTDAYSIGYPSDWDINQTGVMGSTLVLFSPVASEEDQFRENVNLAIQDLGETKMSLKEFTKLSVHQIKTFITDGNIIKSETITSESTQYQKLIYTGKQGVFNLQFEQYYWIENSTAYLLTLTAEESEFNNYQTIGEKIMNSFEIH